MSDTPIRKTFAWQCMVQALAAEPSWTPLMHCVLNDYSDDLTEQLIAEYERFKADQSQEHP